MGAQSSSCVVKIMWHLDINIVALNINRLVLTFYRLHLMLQDRLME